MRAPALLVLAALTGAACADGGPMAARREGTSMTRPIVVAVAAQPCDRPTRDRGWGVVVGEDLVATAAHTVDGPRRAITVDGAPAVVVAVDRRRDLALLEVPTGDAVPAVLDRTTVTDGAVVTPAGDRAVRVVRTGRLVVNNVSDRTRSERMVHTFEPGVAGGTSGAPLVTPAGAVAGIVLLDRGGVDRADAVTAGELAGLLAEAGDPSRATPDAGPTCLG